MDIRVVYDHQVFSLQEFGGISRYYIELANGLQSSNIVKPEIYAPLYINHYLKDNSKKYKCSSLWVNSDYLKKGIIYRFNSAFCKFAYFQTKPDIVHETYYSNKPIMNGKRRVLTVYDMIEEKYGNQNGNAYSSNLKKKAVERADHIICISYKTKNDLIELFDVNEKKISVIHLSHRTPDEFQSLEINKGYSRPFILYVGPRSGYKNFETFFRAYVLNLKVSKEIDIVCFGGGKFNENEIKLIKINGLGDRVRQVSGNDDSLNYHYKNALFFIYPSIYEGFGIPPLEAMSFGCPVASSNGGSMPEVLGLAPMYFNPLDVDEISNVLTVLSFSERKRSMISKNSLKQASTFSWRKTVEKTELLYKSLV
jgi:glycosyltransferase involved in cell wall biosynthesis